MELIEVEPREAEERPALPAPGAIEAIEGAPSGETPSGETPSRRPRKPPIQFRTGGVGIRRLRVLQLELRAQPPHLRGEPHEPGEVVHREQNVPPLRARRLGDGERRRHRRVPLRGGRLRRRRRAPSSSRACAASAIALTLCPFVSF